MKKHKNKINREEAREVRHNKDLTMEELASRYDKSKRTIYSLLNNNFQEKYPINRKLKRSTSGLENNLLKFLIEF